MAGSEFPYSVGPEDKPINYHMNVQDQMSMYKDNEKQDKAPPVLPYELDRINEVLGSAFVSLAELRNMLARTQASNKTPNGAISQITDKIDKINELILDIPEDLAKIAI
jgi:hypothetical protein|tara:strand:+ start:41 stop:367 length:327 start_codon:yes stop_codon:yes gene_type:complete